MRIGRCKRRVQGRPVSRAAFVMRMTGFLPESSRGGRGIPLRLCGRTRSVDLENLDFLFRCCRLPALPEHFVRGIVKLDEGLAAHCQRTANAEHDGRL